MFFKGIMTTKSKSKVVGWPTCEKPFPLTEGSFHENGGWFSVVGPFTATDCNSIAISYIVTLVS